MEIKLIFLFLCSLETVRSLYEDQAGKFDWRQQYVGKVKYVDFDQSTAGGKRILVGTEKNVLAALNTRNGQLGWRQLFEEDSVGRIDDVIQNSGSVIVVTGGGRYVRSFSSTVGSLNWEVSFDEVDEGTTFKAHLCMIGKYKVGVVTAVGLMVLDFDSGDFLWKKEFPKSDGVTYTIIHNSEEKAFLVGYVSGSHVVITTYKETGSQVSQNTVPAAWIGSHVSCMLVAGSLLCLDSRSATLQTVSLTAPKVFKTTLIQDLGVSSFEASLVEFQASQSDGSETQFVLKLSASHMALMSLHADGNVKLIKDLPGVSAVQMTKYSEKKTLVTLGRIDSEVAEVHGYTLEDGSEVPEIKVKMAFPQHHGLAQQLYLLMVRKKDGSMGMRVVVASEDHSLIMFQHSGHVSVGPKGKITWTREEALSSVLAVEMVDLPLSQIQVKMEEEFAEQDDIFGMFVKRISGQVAQLKEFVLQLRHKLKIPRHSHTHQEVDIEEEDEDEEDEDYLTRDEFNIHKMIVVTTSAGKMFGLDSYTGRIVWRYFIADLLPFMKNKEILPLFVQRTTAHYPHLPQCAILGKHKVSGRGLLFTFNPISGQPTDDMPPAGLELNYDILQVTSTAQMDAQFLRPLIILDKQLKYHVYPTSSLGLVQDLAPSLFMFTTDVKEGMLHGYSTEVSSGQQIFGREIWSINLQKDQQTITNIVAKRASEHVHSQGLVLGDRSVLYKYLNPNVILITTEGVETGQKGGQPFLSVYLIDSVNGQIIFHCNHKKSKGPVNVILSENWVVYNYWNTKQRRTEVAVLELYEGTKQSNATVFSSLSPPPAPLVMRQAYILSSYLSSMAVTVTEKGITNKHLLIALNSGGILELPKALVDARRPLEYTQEHREEGLMQYIPELPRPFEAMVNYNQSVYNIKGIHTAPAGLESMCLVLAYGLDLFFTRVSPSKMFDVLKDDFDYFFISSVLIGMITVSVITQKLAAKKAINRQWK